MQSLYIHIPFCKSKCSYCDFFSIKSLSSSFVDAYVNALCNEIAFRLDDFRISRLSSVYIGGGTPSVLSDENIRKIACVLYSKIDGATEFSIEVNPDDITKDKLSLYADSGINRISIGIQALEDGALKCVGRRSDTKKNIDALALISNKWKGDFSADMIAALPHQKKDDFLEGLKTLVSFNPSHISMYSLTFEEGTKLYSDLTERRFSYDFDFADEMWISGRDFLLENGFEQYEISNFYRKNGGKKCAHNLCYWNMEDYAAAGSGGTGSIYKNPSFRYTNTTDIKSYIDFWGKTSDFSGHRLYETTENLSEETLIFEYFMMGLRKGEGVSLFDFRKRFKKDIPKKVKLSMEKWILDGKAKKEICGGEERFFLNRDGLLFLNRFLEEIL